MKILTLVLNSLLARAQVPSENQGFVSGFTAKSIRKVILFFIGILAGLMLFLGGFFTVLMDLILTSRDSGQLALSTASIVGFGLIGLSAATQTFLLSKKNWDIPANPSSQGESHINPMYDAAAELIRDFTEERRLMRMVKFQQQTESEERTKVDDTNTGPIVGIDTNPTGNRSVFN